MRRTIARSLLSAIFLAAIWGDAAPAATESVRNLVQEAREQARQGNHRGAAEILARAKMIAPNSEEVLSDFAENSLAAGNPGGAIDPLEALARMHPVVAKYPYLLGVAQMKIKALKPSVDSLRHSLELDSGRALTWIALGLTLNTLKWYDQAQEAILRGLEIEPENVEALVALAEAEEGLGELEQVEVHANRALALGGPHPGAYFALGKARMSQGRFDEARDLFLQTLAQSPDSPKTHYQLSLAYARLNDPENSKKHRELHQQAMDQESAHLVEMRALAGMGISGMGRE